MTAVTVQCVPLPTAPGLGLVVPVVDDCQVCDNDERVILSTVGARLGTVVGCPGCTRRGARSLRALFAGAPDPVGAA